MARQSKRRSGRRPRSKRPTRWHGAQSTEFDLAAGNSSFELLTAAQANEFKDPVVTRIVGNLTITWTNQTTGVEKSMVSAIRVRSEAGQINPQTNMDANWMWFWFSNFRNTGGLTDQVPQVERVHFDIGVARTVPLDGILHIVFESTDAALVRVQIGARILVKDS